MKSNYCILVCVREDKLPEKSKIDDIIEVTKLGKIVQPCAWDIKHHLLYQKKRIDMCEL